MNKQRAIKFRAWDEKQKRYFSADEMGEDQLTVMPDGRGFINVHSASTKLSQFLPHLEPEQFTGLLDKNGKEIYEGDIVQEYMDEKPRGKPVIVEWKNDLYNCGCCVPAFAGTGFINVDEDFAVIGNVHENPELLTV